MNRVPSLRFDWNGPNAVAYLVFIFIFIFVLVLIPVFPFLTFHANSRSALLQHAIINNKVVLRLPHLAVPKMLHAT